MASLYSDRIIFKDQPDSLEIIIPAKRNWVMLALLIAITIFWWFTGGDSITMLIRKHDAEPLDWIWVLWGLAVILIILRNLWTIFVIREKVTIKQGVLSIKKQGNPLVFTQKYELAKIKYFSTDEDSTYSFFDHPLSNDVGTGTVCFGYNRLNIRFGEGLSEADANHILQKLKSKGLLTDKSL